MRKLKAEQLLQVLKKLGVDTIYNMEEDFNEAIKELDIYVANNQGIKRRLNNPLSQGKGSYIIRARNTCCGLEMVHYNNSFNCTICGCSK